jgi:hypothetical protein
MNKKMIKSASFGFMLSVGILAAGCGTLKLSTWGNPTIITFGAADAGQSAPPPSGSSSWGDYASANGVTSDGNGYEVPSTATEPANTPPPSGYASWDAFNSSPSVSPPSGYGSWNDWASANI